MATYNPMYENAADGTVEEEEEGRDLREYLGLFLEHWLLITFIVLVALGIGLYKAWTAPAVYTAHALIQIERPDQSSAGQPAFASSPFAYNMSRSSAEQEILKSRSIASEAVTKLNMTLSVSPDYLGAAGRAWARGQPAGHPAAPPFDLKFLEPYAWGGEVIQVDRLTVPDGLRGYPFRLTALADGFRLSSANGEQTILQGTVGEAAQGMFRGRKVSLFVSDLQARPRTRFTVVQRHRPGVVGALSGALSVREAGNQTGILDLSLSAYSQHAAESRLSALSKVYRQHNIERQSQQAKQTLQFLRSQLPEQQKEVDKAQAKLRGYQSQNGTVDLSKEAQALLDRASDVQSKLSSLELQGSELLQTYTRKSRQYKALMDQRQQLQTQKRQIEQKLKQLPERQSEFLELSRDAKVSNELYEQLLNRTQELQLAKAGVTGFVRIVDHAYAPNHPSGPNRKSTVLLALVLGFFVAAALVWLRHALKRTIDDPTVVEKRLGLPVYATVPYSRDEHRLARRRRQYRYPTPTVLAHHSKHDVAVESVRSLRTSLQFAFMESDNNILAVSSATPSCGKSFISANLAYLLAEAGERVLLMDSDMRRGQLHKQFSVEFVPGLSNIITGQATLQEAVVSVCDGQHDLLPSGVFPPNPSELLLHARFRQLLLDIRAQYDVVIIDTPPLLNVTDGIIVAKEAGTTFLVGRAEHSTVHEIATSVTRLHQNGLRAAGVVFNGLRINSASSRYGNYGYYGYRYKPS